MAKLPSQEAAALAYAEVYTLVGWMQQKIGYKGIRDADRRAEGRQECAPRGRRCDGHCRGPQVEKEWHAHLKARRSEGARRQGHQVRQGRHRLRERRARERQRARAKKFARLGGMLRARGMLEAAAVEYEKALAAAGPASRSSPASSRAPWSSSASTTARSSLPRPLAAADDHDATPAVTLGIARAATA